MSYLHSLIAVAHGIVEAIKKNNYINNNMQHTAKTQSSLLIVLMKIKPDLFLRKHIISD